MRKEHSHTQKLLDSCPATLELARQDHLDLIRQLAEAFLESRPTAQQLAQLGSELDGSAPLHARLAYKVACSRRFVDRIAEPTHVSVVFAVYKEHNRIRRPDEHPNGEDFLARKVDQLRWLLDANPNVSWDLRLVDDGDPEGTGQIAEEILTTRLDADEVIVLSLDQAIAAQLPVTAPMKSASESSKGGAILYGMWDAVQSHHPNHAVVYTDADLSTHLGQTGLLLRPLLEERKLAAIGSRRQPDSVVVKGSARNDRGKLFIYLWKRLLPLLGDIVDTQCGFKAFRAQAVKEIVVNSIEKGFAFDLELLLKVQLMSAEGIAKVPVAWIDSEAESTTKDLQPYLPMLQSITRLYRHHLPEQPGATEFANFIESLSEAGWAQLTASIPEEITRRDPREFSEFNEISTDDLQARIAAIVPGDRVQPVRGRPALDTL